MALPSEASSAHCTFMAVTDCRLNVFGLVGQIDFPSCSVVHATLGRVSLQFWIMCQVAEVQSERVLYHGWYGTVERGSTNHDAMMVVKEA